jgi:hypothetical protein
MYVRKRVICEWCRWNYKDSELLDELYSEQKLKKIFFNDSLSIRIRIDVVTAVTLSV